MIHPHWPILLIAPKKVRLDDTNITEENTGALTAPDVDGTIWTEGYDGATSGPDADLLDGQEGTVYQDAGNLNTGTISDARLPDIISTSTQTALDQKVSKSGGTLSGPLNLPNLIISDNSNKASTTGFVQSNKVVKKVHSFLTETYYSTTSETE